MKKLLLLSVLFTGLCSAAWAQVCTPDTAHFTAGVVVYPSGLTITQGIGYSGSTNVRIPDSVDAYLYDTILPRNTYFVHIDSVLLDSLSGTPAGIAAATNPGRGVWLHPGQYGCIQFSGTTGAATGTYPISAFGGACVHGNILGYALDSCDLGQLPSFNFFNFNLNVVPVCTADTAGFTTGTIVYPSSLTITQGQAYSGNTNIRVPDSLDASAYDTFLPPNTYFVHIDSIYLDSVSGAPAGISGATAPGGGAWLHPGQYGCIQFAGATGAAAGTYPILAYGGACVHGNILGLAFDSCETGQLPTPQFFTFDLVVTAPGTLCTVDTAGFAGGAYVYPTSLPCITPGVPYSGTVSILIPDSVDASTIDASLPAGFIFAHIDSIRLDSITGAPAGIAVYPNTGGALWLHPGQYACALFQGTTTAAPGNFPIGLYGRGCVHGSYMGISIDTCADKNLGAVFNFSLNVCGGACVVDTTQFSGSTYVYPPPTVLQCIITGDAYSGQINIEVPDSLDISDFISTTSLTIPPGAGFAHIDSIAINTVTGYPAGISLTTNPSLGAWLKPYDVACAVFSGTVNAAVTPAGAYPLTILGTACGYTHTVLHIQGFNIPINIDSCFQNYNLSNVFPYTLYVCNPAGIAQVTDGVNLTIFPNPNQGSFTVTVSSSDHISGALSILDQLGRVVYTQGVDVTGTKQVPLDLSNVSAGAYLLMINTGASKSVKEFIINK